VIRIKITNHSTIHFRQPEPRQHRGPEDHQEAERAAEGAPGQPGGHPAPAAADPGPGGTHKKLKIFFKN
jgi:hypothetical protein